jgi:CMP-N,N'-diacetyllegionaminic acid synthase
MKVIAIIPARGGSKRLPRKNIKMLGGKPLIAYTIESALKSKYIHRVIVSTEDYEIASVARKFGAEVIDRPAELAQDTTKTPPVMLHAVEDLEKKGYTPDIIVLLQCTAPLRDEKLIDAGIEKLINSDNDSVFTGQPRFRTMALWKKNHNGTMNALYDYHLRPRWQDVHLNEMIYGEDGAFYAIKIEAFKKHRDFIGENPDIMEVPYNIDIDTEEDFEEIEKILKEKVKKMRKGEAQAQPW